MYDVCAKFEDIAVARRDTYVLHVVHASNGFRDVCRDELRHRRLKIFGTQSGLFETLRIEWNDLSGGRTLESVGCAGAAKRTWSMLVCLCLREIC